MLFLRQVSLWIKFLDDTFYVSSEVNLNSMLFLYNVKDLLKTNYDKCDLSLKMYCGDKQYLQCGVVWGKRFNLHEKCWKMNNNRRCYTVACKYPATHVSMYMHRCSKRMHWLQTSSLQLLKCQIFNLRWDNIALGPRWPLIFCGPKQVHHWEWQTKCQMALHVWLFKSDFSTTDLCHVIFKVPWQSFFSASPLKSLQTAGFSTDQSNSER